MSPQIIVKGKTEKALNGFNKAEGPENGRTSRRPGLMMKDVSNGFARSF